MLPGANKNQQRQVVVNTSRSTLHSCTASAASKAGKGALSKNELATDFSVLLCVDHTLDQGSF